MCTKKQLDIIIKSFQDPTFQFNFESINSLKMSIVKWLLGIVYKLIKNLIEATGVLENDGHQITNQTNSN